MEKIYMEDNNKQTRRGLVDFSVILSFTVAVFAIFSIATFGIFSFQGTNVSYAAPLTDDSQFIFTQAVYDGADDYVLITTGGEAGSHSFNTPIYLAGSGTNYNNIVYCVEHNVEPPDNGTTVKKTEAITDYGLLYLLNNSYSNGRPRTNITDETKRKFVEAYITQVAIWIYMYETQPNVVRDNAYGIYRTDGTEFAPEEGQPDTGIYNGVSVNFITDEDLNAIKTATALYIRTQGVIDDALIYNGDSVYEKYIKPLVDEAKSASSQKAFSITHNSDDVSKTSDGKFYQTPLVNVFGVPPEDLLSYDITLGGVDGAFLVDENGRELATTGIPGGKKFYIRVPVEKVAEGKEVAIQISGVGHFNTLTGNYYLAETDGNASQKIVTVNSVPRDLTAADVIKFVGSGDTAMNAAQTVYFIGLIILLCGVGIIYANAKPVEVEQQ